MDIYWNYKTVQCNNSNTKVCLLHKWFSLYCIVIQQFLDNGAQFVSQEFANFMRELGIKHMWTAVYHHSSNGQAERYVQNAKHGLESNSN